MIKQWIQLYTFRRKLPGYMWRSNYMFKFLSDSLLVQDKHT